jgi:hypothetical protein
MAISPIVSRGLHPWLHLQSTRLQTHRPQWRSDWVPVWTLLLLISILGLFSFIMPANNSIEKAKQAVQDTQKSSVISAAIERGD